MILLQNQLKSCCFIGHRKIVITNELVITLKELIKNLIVNYGVVFFLFGSKSQFNDLCHRVVTKFKEKYSHIKRIAYTCRSETCVLEGEKQNFEKIYSNVLKKEESLLVYDEEFEHKTKYTSGKASYVERNCAMINNSDYCVFYYDENYQPQKRKTLKQSASSYQPNSGTRLAYEYAKQKKKIIYNIVDN